MNHNQYKKKQKKPINYYEYVQKEYVPTIQNSGNGHITKLMRLQKEFTGLNQKIIDQILISQNDDELKTRVKITEILYGKQGAKDRNEDIQNNQINNNSNENSNVEQNENASEFTDVLPLWDNDLEGKISDDVLSNEISKDLSNQFPNIDYEKIKLIVIESNMDPSLASSKLTQISNHSNGNNNVIGNELLPENESQTANKEICKKEIKKEIDLINDFPENKDLTEGVNLDPNFIQKRKELQFQEIKRQFPTLDRKEIEVYFNGDYCNLAGTLKLLRDIHPEKYIKDPLLLPEAKSEEQNRIFSSIQKDSNYSFQFSKFDEDTNPRISSRMIAELKFKAMNAYWRAAKSDYATHNYPSYHYNIKKAREYKVEYLKARNDAVQSILSTNNFLNNKYELDLHGLYSKEAISLVESKLHEISIELDSNSNHKSNFYIITGKGLHSKGSPIIKERIIKYLNDHNYDYSVKGDNSGIVVVHFR